MIDIWITWKFRSNRAIVLNKGPKWGQQFAKKGISFTAAGNKYVSQKEGAEIRFTKDGIKLDGVAASQ